MAGPAYVTRETILDVGGYGSVIADRIDRAIFTASRRIEDTLHRRFYPLSAAVTYHEPYEPSNHVGDEAFWLKDDLQSASRRHCRRGSGHHLHPAPEGRPTL
jgi:hypothetical protein